MKQSKLDRLKELRDYCNFKNADFGYFGDEVIGRCSEFIRDRTRIYRDTWILPVIDELIAEEERKVEMRKLRKNDGR